jgi:hypothetical protein
LNVHQDDIGTMRGTAAAKIEAVTGRQTSRARQCCPSGGQRLLAVYEVGENRFLLVEDRDLEQPRSEHPSGSHVAPLGLVSYTADSLPQKYRGGAFVREHGSWDRQQFNGYKVVFVPFSAEGESKTLYRRREQRRCQCRRKTIACNGLRMLREVSLLHRVTSNAHDWGACAAGACEHHAAPAGFGDRRRVPEYSRNYGRKVALSFVLHVTVPACDRIFGRADLSAPSGRKSEGRCGNSMISLSLRHKVSLTG